MALDLSPVVRLIAEQSESVGLVGAACLMVWGAIVAFKHVREALDLGGGGERYGGGPGYESGGFSGDDYWDHYSVVSPGGVSGDANDFYDGYTAEDDARDRAAAGLSAGGGWTPVDEDEFVRNMALIESGEDSRHG